MAKSEASHMISKGFDQSGAWIIEAEISSFLSFYKAIKCSSLKSKGMFLANRLVKGPQSY